MEELEFNGKKITVEDLKNEEAFLDILYSIEDKEDILKLMKLRLLEGGGIDLTKIVKRSHNIDEEELDFEYRYKKHKDIDINNLDLSNHDIETQDFHELICEERDIILMLSEKKDIYYKIEVEEVFSISNRNRIEYYVIEAEDIPKLFDFLAELIVEKNIEENKKKKLKKDFFSL